MPALYSLTCHVLKSQEQVCSWELGEEISEREVIQQSFGILVMDNYTLSMGILCRFEFSLYQQLQVRLFGFSSDLHVCFIKAGFLEVNLSTISKKLELSLAENSYCSIRSGDTVSIPVCEGKSVFSILLCAPRFTALPYSVTRLSGRTGVYWNLFSESIKSRNYNIAEQSLLGFLYGVSKGFVQDIFYPLPFCVRVYEIASRIINGYQTPDIVNRALKNVRMDRRVFYHIFKLFYGTTPTGLCMRIRFVHESIIRRDNPDIDESIVAERIGFSNVSNYKRARFNYYKLPSNQ